jgi:hypothetical protein
MITKACIVPGPHSPVAYNRRMTRQGPTYRERQKERVTCAYCQTSMQAGHLPTHLHDQHHISRVPDPTPLDTDSNYYRVTIPPQHAGKISCPVPDCSAQLTGTAYHLRRHFMHRHTDDVIEITNEGLLPRCPHCRMFVKQVDDAHLRTSECQKGFKRNVKRQTVAIQVAACNHRFTVNGSDLEVVHHFRYLGRLLSDDDDDFFAIKNNICKARQKWARLSAVLSREGATCSIMGKFYKAIVQAVLLYGSETWVISQRLLRLLDSFHNRCARYIARRHIRQNEDGTWFCPDTKTTLRKAGLFSVSEYIRRRKAHLLHSYAKFRPIYHTCVLSSPAPTNPNQLVWW